MFRGSVEYSIKPTSSRELFDAIDSALRPSTSSAYGRNQYELPSYEVEWLDNENFENGFERIEVRKGMGILRRAIITVREDETYDEIPMLNRSLLGLERDEAWDFFMEVSSRLAEK